MKSESYNKNFLNCLEKSFLIYLERGARSTAKLKILHPYIAQDLRKFLGNEYQVYSLDKNDGKEKKISGRYFDKKVDILITKGNLTVAGFGVKFIMSNYKQNSNNYFENMLGETANIRTNTILYFQIVICFAYPLYFHKEKNQERIIKTIEEINSRHLKKYRILSSDNIVNFLHSPNKTFLTLVNFKNINCKELFENGKLKTFVDFIRIVKESDIQLEFSPLKIHEWDLDESNNKENIFKKNLIFNDYQKYIEKCSQLIKGSF